MMRILFAAGFVVSVLVGCASSDVTFEVPAVNTIPSERIIFKDFASVWQNVNKGLARGFATVKEAKTDSDAGVVVINFSSTDPRLFADCGLVHVTYDDSAGIRVTTGAFLEPAAFPVWRTNSFGLLRLDTEYRDQIRLRGTANVYVSPIAEEQTLVSVKVGYVLSYRQRVVDEDGDELTNETRKIRFSTHYPADDGPTCVARGAFEENILQLAEDQSARLVEPCLIKGVVLSGDRRLYYAPGHPDYERRKVRERRGGRWFCTEEDAMAAGWEQPT
jgi:hypothetical protein